MTAAPQPDLGALLRHADWVHRLALRLCADEHAAADAVQETWTAALRRPPRHGGNLRAWLGRLLRNCAGMAARGDRRRRAREGARAPESFAEAAAETVARADLHRHLAALVLELPEPQRTLVLLHHFEGEDRAALARRFSLTADAVRAHLRRARASLRERLQRGEPRVQRAFAALLATHALTALTMTLTTKTVVAAGGIAAAALLYTFWPAPPPPAPAVTGSGNAPVAAATAQAPDATGAERPVDAATRERRDVTPPSGRTWAVRLDGLRPEAPWTAKMHVEAEGKDEQKDEWLRANAVVEFAHGDAASLPRPAWLDRADRLKVRLRADDPNYRPVDLDLRNDDDGLRARGEFVLPVQVVGVLTGRVVDFHGEPVPAARVCAFAATEGTAPLGTANTAADGSYVVQVPPATPLLVAAAPMREASLSGKRMTGAHGAIADDGSLRHDLLPASVAASARPGAPTPIDDLVLREPAMVTCSVAFTDGTPVARAELFLTPQGMRTLELAEQVGLQLRDDGRLAPVSGARTDDDGRFSFACLPGATVGIGVLSIDGCFPYGDSGFVHVTAPGEAQFTVPLPITLRPLLDGRPCANARFELPHQLHADTRDGRLRLILFEPGVSLRVRAGTARSRAIDLRREQAGTTIDVDLDEALAPVAIEFSGDGKVRQAMFEFTPLQGGEPLREYLLRDDRGEPFRLAVVPGRYRLDVHAAPGESGSTFLRPQSLELEVGAAGGSWTLPMAFAGRIRVAVTDRDGRFVTGRCTLRDGSGHERVPRFVVRKGAFASVGAPGELLGEDVNELAELLEPGDYELELDLGAHGIQRRRVTVRAREVAEVAIRLP